jgi:hypothetical protein
VVVHFVKLTFAQRGSAGRDTIQMKYITNKFVCKGT